MPERHRVTRTPSALYAEPKRARKRRRCSGHLAEPHMIEVGDLIVWSSLPPDSDIGNEGWWHAAFCADCAPIESLPALSALASSSPTPNADESGARA